MLKTISVQFLVQQQGQRMHALIKLPDNSVRIVRVSAWAGCIEAGLPPADLTPYLLLSDGGNILNSAGTPLSV